MTSVAASPLTVAVIGHVNHGKTALVRALTGIETDRLKEERDRGLSITLGFAWRDYPSGTVDLIDSPGHEDFIRAMVSGATGARAVLLVVSATEGFAPQTWEHLQIATLLGIRAGVVAVTKSDLLAPGEEATVRAKVEDGLAGTFLAGEPIVFCSATTRESLGTIDLALEALHVRIPPPATLPGAFLSIDRAFSVTGAGTIVTGTLQGAPLKAADAAVLLPGGHPASVRQIQVHGAAVAEAPPGGRVAVGLRGVGVDDVRTGDVLCAAGLFEASEQMDVLITVADHSARPIKHLEELRLMWGTARATASVRLLGAKTLPAGAHGMAQLRFNAPVIAFAGQRGVLRRLSPAETVGGVEIIDPAASPGRRRNSLRQSVLEAAVTANPERIATAMAARDGGVIAIRELARLARQSEAVVTANLAAQFDDLGDGRLAPRTLIAEIRDAYLAALVAAHEAAPIRLLAPAAKVRSGLATLGARDVIAHVERVLASDGRITLVGAQVSLVGHDPLRSLPAVTLARLEAMEAALRQGGVSPRDPAVLSGREPEGEDLLALLVDLGRAVSLRNVALRQTLVFHREALAAAAEQLRERFPSPATFTTGEAREALATSRKFIVPLLEHFDGQGLTRRDGDVRETMAAGPATAGLAASS